MASMIIAFKGRFKTLICLPFPSNTQKDYYFFNCSEYKHDYYLWPLPSGFLSTNTVYASPSYYLTSEVNLSSCQKIFNATLLEYLIFHAKWEISMSWSKPMCGKCEREGKKCQLKKNDSTEPEIECIDKPAEGNKLCFFISCYDLNMHRKFSMVFNSLMYICSLCTIKLDSN